MRWCLLVFRSLYTVIFLILDQPSQFDLPRLLQPVRCTAVGASDEIREKGTSGLGTDLGSAFRAVAQALTATPSDKGGSGSKVWYTALSRNTQR